MSKKLVGQVIQILKEIIPPQSGSVSLHEPEFKGNEWNYVKDCIDSGWVSSVGEYVNRFEKEVARFTGTSYAVATANGTAALHLSLHLAGVTRGDEVLVPALTFVATANAVSYCGAIPHFVDCDEKTLGVDPKKLSDYLKKNTERDKRGCFNRITKRPMRALIVMHTFGHPSDMNSLTAVCEEYGITLIEDAAESLGSYYKSKHTGGFGQLAALSFNGNKIVTTGGGGALITNDERLAKLAKHLSTTAKEPHRWNHFHDQVGFNYRMPNINAALGCAQIEKLPLFLKNKRALAKKYQEAFKDIKGFKVFKELDGCESNYWLNTLILDEDLVELRDSLLEATHGVGFMTRPAWNLMHTLPMYKDCPRMDLSIAENLERRIVNLPSSAKLGVA